MMVRKYGIVMKSEDGRILAQVSHGVICESGHDEADVEAMEQLGLKLMREASALRRAVAVPRKPF